MSRREPDYRRAKAVAARILRENNIVRPPILPREIAERYGLKIQVADFASEDNEVAGFLDFGSKTVYVNSLDHFNRQTFTIAHELGHFCLHLDMFEKYPARYKVLMRRPIGAEVDPVEKEANAFAAELLVPRKFLELYSKYADVDELAKLFAVSREVIGYRLNFGRTAES